jgi:exonuclease III
LVQIKKCKDPFGGVSVIAVGDFYQLPPVKQRKDERLYKENFLYPVDFWLDSFKVVELTQIMRQREDIPFATALNSLRCRLCHTSLDNEIMSLLNECIREGPDDILHVYSTNDEVNTFNMTMLRKSCEELIEINALDYTKDNTSGKLMLKKKPLAPKKNDSLSSCLLMGIGARVMLTRNINVNDGLVNGVMGYITQFVYKQGCKENIVLAVGVKFDNPNVGKSSWKKTNSGNIVLIERVHEDLKENKTKTVVRHQFPLRLSWACTAHKVQGMTVNKVVVNLDRTFSAGQAYVALSRVTSKDGLFIESEDSEKISKKIYADPEVQTALQQMPILPLPDWKSKSEQGVTIFLLNIQSLQTHFEDLIRDDRWRNSDIIALTETWLKPGQDVKCFDIAGYHFHHVSRAEVYDDSSPQLSKLQSSKGGGVAVYLNKSSSVEIALSGVERNVEGIAVKSVSSNIAILSVYRPRCYSVSQFLLNLQKTIKKLKLHYKSIVCIGDFNEDANAIGPIQVFMDEHSLKQVVGFNTTEGATLLDHVYVPSSLRAETQKVSTYYSYHEALLVTLMTST